MIIIENSINLLCVSLQFRFNDRIYYKLCRKCNKRLKDRYEYVVSGYNIQSIKTESVMNGNTVPNSVVIGPKPKLNVVYTQSSTNDA